MSDSVRPHRRQPTRVPRPWDSPGKNTGVGCHFFLQCMKVKSESEVTQLCPTLSNPMDCSPPGSSVHGIFQARVLEWVAISSSVVSNSLRPVDCSPPGSSVHGAFQARILEWVAISFSKGSSLPRDRTRTPTLQTDTLTSEPPGKPTWKVDVLNYVLSLGQIPGTPSPWSLPLGQACPMLKETAGPSMGQRAKNSWPLCPAGSPL